MTDENKSSLPSSGNEPEAPRSAAPMWIIVITLVLLFLGGLYFDRHSGWFSSKVYAPYKSSTQLEAYQPQSGAAAERARGKSVYNSVCGICHGTDGEGKPGQAPPLAGSEWVNTKGFNRLAHIPLMGLSGPLEVKGKQWTLSMAPMGAALSDDDLAAVLTYIRSSWGNKAPAVTGDDIKQIRAKMGPAKPLDSEKLKALPE